MHLQDAPTPADSPIKLSNPLWEQTPWTDRPPQTALEAAHCAEQPRLAGYFAEGQAVNPVAEPPAGAATQLDLPTLAVGTDERPESAASSVDHTQLAADDSAEPPAGAATQLDLLTLAAGIERWLESAASSVDHTQLAADDSAAQLTDAADQAAVGEGHSTAGSVSMEAVPHTAQQQAQVVEQLNEAADISDSDAPEAADVEARPHIMDGVALGNSVEDVHADKQVQIPSSASVEDPASAQPMSGTPIEVQDSLAGVADISDSDAPEAADVEARPHIMDSIAMGSTMEEVHADKQVQIPSSAHAADPASAEPFSGTPMEVEDRDSDALEAIDLEARPYNMDSVVMGNSLGDVHADKQEQIASPASAADPASAEPFSGTPVEVEDSLANAMKPNIGSEYDDGSSKLKRTAEPLSVESPQQLKEASASSSSAFTIKWPAADNHAARPLSELSGLEDSAVPPAEPMTQLTSESTSSEGPEVQLLNDEEQIQDSAGMQDTQPGQDWASEDSGDYLCAPDQGQLAMAADGQAPAQLLRGVSLDGAVHPVVGSDRTKGCRSSHRQGFILPRTGYLGLQMPACLFDNDGSTAHEDWLLRIHAGDIVSDDLASSRLAMSDTPAVDSPPLAPGVMDAADQVADQLFAEFLAGASTGGLSAPASGGDMPRQGMPLLVRIPVG